MVYIDLLKCLGSFPVENQNPWSEDDILQRSTASVVDMAPPSPSSPPDIPPPPSPSPPGEQHCWVFDKAKASEINCDSERLQEIAQKQFPSFPLELAAKILCQRNSKAGLPIEEVHPYTSPPPQPDSEVEELLDLFTASDMLQAFPGLSGYSVCSHGL